MNVRRYYVPNSIVFLTQVVDGRQPVFQHRQHLDLLRTVLHNVKEIHPFQMLAYVFLPEHFHLLIRPTGASTFSDIMQSLKRNFTLEYKESLGIKGRMKFWQKGFWDHVIRDEDDFSNHLDYIHYNPVKHGLVTHPEDWPHSSFMEWKQRGVYPDRWGWSLPDSIDLISWNDAECMVVAAPQARREKPQL
jgi:putative transposase